MDGLRKKVAALVDSWKTTQAKSAQKTMLEELFNDLYANRTQIYKLNFFRGIFFGLGSVLGGTIVLALLVWIISLFVNFPVIGNFFEQTQQTLQDTTKPE